MTSEGNAYKTTTVPKIRQKASAGPATKDSDFSEMRGVYPDAHMIDGTGDAPACGLWARHVRGLYLEGYEVRPAGNDPRPFLVSADAEFASPVPEGGLPRQ